MSSDPTITPPPVDTPPTPVAAENAPMQFSGIRWFFTGIVRVLYRQWTRIAAHLFPEDSKAEQLANTLHIPLPDRLNMTWITDQLAVGGRVRPQDIRALANTGITHVVDTRSEHRDDAEALSKVAIELLHLPTADTHPLTVQQLLEGAQWVKERMDRGGRVLIHCEHGVGRSVQMTCAVLIYCGMKPREALELIQQKRWQAAPNYKQIERLREFAAALSARPSA